MRFTVVATGQFSLERAFGFRLAASSLLQLSVVNSPIRPAGLSPAWHPASPAHTRNPKLKRPICNNLLGVNALEKSHQTPAGMASIFPRCYRSNILPQLGHFNFGFRV